MQQVETAPMSKILHVTLITETFTPEINGVANTLGRLCDGLRLRGHRVELIEKNAAMKALFTARKLQITNGTLQADAMAA